MTFIEIYENSDKDKKIELRDEICKLCDITISSFYMWTGKQKRKIPRKKQIKISELLNKPRLELFPLSQSIIDNRIEETLSDSANSIYETENYKNACDCKKANIRVD